MGIQTTKLVSRVFQRNIFSSTYLHAEGFITTA